MSTKRHLKLAEELIHFNIGLKRKLRDRENECGAPVWKHLHSLVSHWIQCNYNENGHRKASESMKFRKLIQNWVRKTESQEKKSEHISV